MMLRTVLVVLVAGYSLLSAANDTLSGTVKEGSGTAIAGAVVNLAKQPTLKATSDADGKFSIVVPSSGVALPLGIAIENAPKFGVNGKMLQFAISSDCQSATLSLFKSNGRLLTIINLGSLKAGVQQQALPVLASGFYIMQVALDGHKTTLNLIATGNACYIDDAQVGTSGKLVSRTAAVSVDTLIVSKGGYATVKVPVTAYATKDVPIVMEKEGPVACKLSDLPATSALKENKKLPNPFAFFDGTEITKKSQWPCLRKEILNMAYKYMYGPMPPFEAPDVEVKGTVSSSGVKAEIAYQGKTATLNFATSGSGEILLISMGAGIPPPQTHRTFSVSNTQVDSWKNNCKSLFGITPCGEIAIGWGCNILCRAISSNPDGGIDSNKIMTTGCSNTAKAAFLAAAFCEGIDLTVVVESGGFGDASFRVAQYLYNDKNGWKCSDPPQGVWKPDNGSQWLAPPYMDENVSKWLVNTPANIYKLPYDQHMIAACIAPRAACLLTNQNGQGDGKGEWCHLNGTGSAISYWAAEPVWNALGVPENFGGLMYTESSCPGHCGNPPPASASTLANAFFKRVFEGDKTAKTDVLEANDVDLQMPKSKWKEVWVDWNMETKLE